MRCSEIILYTVLAADLASRERLGTHTAPATCCDAHPILVGRVAIADQTAAVVDRWHELHVVMQVLKQFNKFKTVAFLQLGSSRSQNSFNRLFCRAMQIHILADFNKVLAPDRETDVFGCARVCHFSVQLFQVLRHLSVIVLWFFYQTLPIEVNLKR